MLLKSIELPLIGAINDVDVVVVDDDDDDDDDDGDDDDGDDVLGHS